MIGHEHDIKFKTAEFKKPNGMIRRIKIKDWATINGRYIIEAENGDIYSVSIHECILSTSDV